MHKPIIWIVIAITILCLGCSNTGASSASGTLDEKPLALTQKNTGYQTADLTWLAFADPKADATSAIQNGDLRLLAFTGRARTFPGIEDDVTHIQEQCGYQLLANTSDALELDAKLSARKKLYQYAATYNQIVWSACHNKHMLPANQ